LWVLEKRGHNVRMRVIAWTEESDVIRDSRCLVVTDESPVSRGVVWREPWSDPNSTLQSATMSEEDSYIDFLVGDYGEMGSHIKVWIVDSHIVHPGSWSVSDSCLDAR
jgi:hypothetical protein